MKKKKNEKKATTTESKKFKESNSKSLMENAIKASIDLEKAENSKANRNASYLAGKYLHQVSDKNVLKELDYPNFKKFCEDNITLGYKRCSQLKNGYGWHLEFMKIPEIEKSIRDGFVVSLNTIELIGRNKKHFSDERIKNLIRLTYIKKRSRCRIEKLIAKWKSEDKPTPNSTADKKAAALEKHVRAIQGIELDKKWFFGLPIGEKNLVKEAIKSLIELSESFENLLTSGSKQSETSDD